ncbi:MAG: hypothetical protein C5B48_15540 [Candidatus Rokuibacteriota bacterium]|nr:MAG: hypothetical protein C5B48_15540 [Candidatus Rokubacteria bacterium]
MAPASTPAATTKRPSSLRILALPRLLRLRAGLAVILGCSGAQAALEVVEDQPHRRFRRGSRSHGPSLVTHDEHAAVECRGLELHERLRTALELFGRGEQPPRSLGEARCALGVCEGRGHHAALLVQHYRSVDLGGDLGQIGKSLGGIHGGTLTQPYSQPMRQPFAKFLSDRGTHLAAMIAYYALLSFVPLTFLAFSLLGFTGRADESSYLVRELSRIFPQSSVSSIVRAVNEIRRNSATLGIVGLVILLWSSLSLFGALESALNIVYGRPNRSFLRGKALATALMLGLLVLLFVGLLVGSLGYSQLERHAPGVTGNRVIAYALSILASSLAIFAFLMSVYYLLTNVEQRLADVLPGALLGTVVLQTTFQVLPVYLSLSKNSPGLQAFGGPAILLVWLYVMANVIVFGAEINWWMTRREVREPEQAAGLA